EQHVRRLCAAVLPGMLDAARHEGASAGATDGDIVANLERDLAVQHVGHLVAAMMQMEPALCSCGDGLLEQHDAASGRSAQEFEHQRPAWRYVPDRALSRQHNDPLCTHRRSLRQRTSTSTAFVGDWRIVQPTGEWASAHCTMS